MLPKIGNNFSFCVSVLKSCLLQPPPPKKKRSFMGYGLMGRWVRDGCSREKASVHAGFSGGVGDGVNCSTLGIWK